MGYHAYTKCQDCCVCPVLDYGAEIMVLLNSAPKLEHKETWAARALIQWCTDLVQRQKLYPQLSVIIGDICWCHGSIRKKIAVLRYWNRLMKWTTIGSQRRYLRLNTVNVSKAVGAIKIETYLQVQTRRMYLTRSQNVTQANLALCKA